jgi:hypothetical protein
VEVTWFQPRPTIFPRRTMTAPKGPPQFARIFERESRMAARINFSFMQTI